VAEPRRRGALLHVHGHELLDGPSSPGEQGQRPRQPSRGAHHQPEEHRQQRAAGEDLCREQQEQTTVRGEHRHALVCREQAAVGEGRDGGEHREERGAEALPRQHVARGRDGGDVREHQHGADDEDRGHVGRHHKR